MLRRYSPSGRKPRAAGDTLVLGLEYYRRALAIAQQLHQAEPHRADFAGCLSVSYERLGDFCRTLGQTELALEAYQRKQEIAERLYRAQPQRADFAWDLVRSHVSLGLATSQRHWLEQARDILRQLRDQGRRAHQETKQVLEWLEQQLGD